MMRVAAATLLALLALAAPASAATEVAALGTIRAELSYTKHRDFPFATGVALRVFDGETQIAERLVKDKEYLAPIGVDTGTRSVSVRDLDADGIGEAVFDLYSGGAHCCAITYLYDGATEVIHNWADPGYSFRDYGGDGVPEFRSADSRFQYTVADSFAASFPPVQVFRLVDGALVDVTRDVAVEPAVLRDSRFARRMARKDPIYQELVKSTLAAYAADQCTLGDCGRGYDLIRASGSRGELSRAKRFLGRVRKLLRRLDYDR